MSAPDRRALVDRSDALSISQAIWLLACARQPLPSAPTAHDDDLPLMQRIAACSRVAVSRLTADGGDGCGGRGTLSKLWPQPVQRLMLGWASRRWGRNRARLSPRQGTGLFPCSCGTWRSTGESGVVGDTNVVPGIGRGSSISWQ